MLLKKCNSFVILFEKNFLYCVDMGNFCYNEIMYKTLLKYLCESCFIIIVLPYLFISYATSITGLGISIVFFMVILPVYLILSPLTIDIKPIIILFIPIFNSILFLLSVRITFNNNADNYLIVYMLLAYLVILIKFIYKHYKNKI